MRSLCLLVLIAVPAPQVWLFAEGQDVAQVPADIKPQTLIKVSKETTYYTEPLTPDGYVDYIEALNRDYSQGVTVENNLEVVLRELLGSKSIDESIRAEYFRRLGVELPSTEDGSFTELMSFAEGQGVSDEGRRELLDRYASRIEAPWVEADDRIIAGWIKANNAALDRLNEESKRPRFYVPYLASDQEEGTLQSVVSVLLPSIQEIRELARALSVRAMLRIGNGELDGAWEDLQTIHRLGEHVGGGMTLIEGLVAVAVRSIAYAGQRQVLLSGKLTSEQLERFRDDLNATLPQIRLDEKIDKGERVFGLSVVQQLAQSSTQDAGKATEIFGNDELGTMVTQLLRTRGATWVDWNVILDMFNDYYDRLAALGKETDTEKRRQLFNALDQQFEELTKNSRSPFKSGLTALFGGPEGRGKQLGAVLCALLLPAVQQAYNATWRIEATADVTRLGFAAEGYRMTHKEYPASLDLLADQFDGTLPLDPYTRSSYRYVKHADGFVVYSVGINQRDDGGLTYGETNDANTDADDVRFRITRP